MRACEGKGPDEDLAWFHQPAWRSIRTVNLLLGQQFETRALCTFLGTWGKGCAPTSEAAEARSQLVLVWYWDLKREPANAKHAAPHACPHHSEEQSENKRE